MNLSAVTQKGKKLWSSARTALTLTMLQARETAGLGSKQVHLPKWNAPAQNLKILTAAEGIQRTRNTKPSQGKALKVIGAGSNLQGLDLSRTNILAKSNLQGANLSKTNLSCANLSCANLRDANLKGADLTQADFGGANLQGVDLHKARLQGTNFQNATLRGVNAQGTHFYGVDSLKADLSGANLRGATLEQNRFENTLFRDTNLEHTAWLNNRFGATDFTGAKTQGARVRNYDYGASGKPSLPSQKTGMKILPPIIGFAPKTFLPLTPAEEANEFERIKKLANKSGIQTPIELGDDFETNGSIIRANPSKAKALSDVELTYVLLHEKGHGIVPLKGTKDVPDAERVRAAVGHSTGSNIQHNHTKELLCDQYAIDQLFNLGYPRKEIQRAFYTTFKRFDDSPSRRLSNSSSPTHPSNWVRYKAISQRLRELERASKAS
ncbi:MAG: pentapeptide repeat-containing protein [Vampirovibrionales bacterium]